MLMYLNFIKWIFIIDSIYLPNKFLIETLVQCLVIFYHLFYINGENDELTFLQYHSLVIQKIQNKT